MRRVELHEIPEKFWAKVDKTGECWVWTGSIDRGGYGNFWLRDSLVPGAPSNPRPDKNGRVHPATRVAWYVAHGTWPDVALDVCHTCDNPPCVRPDHLWLGTELDNIRDARAKGRLSRMGAPGGEGHPFAKLTNQQVDDILLAIAAGARNRDLAAQYGVSPSLISMYRSGKRRKSITADRRSRDEILKGQPMYALPEVREIHAAG